MDISNEIIVEYQAWINYNVKNDGAFIVTKIVILESLTQHDDAQQCNQKL